MKSGGHRKSFSGSGLKTSPSVNKTNPTSMMKHAAGFTGRATTPTTKPYTKKGNP